MAEEGKPGWTGILLNSQLAVIALGGLAWLASTYFERVYLGIYGIPADLPVALGNQGVAIYMLLFRLTLALIAVVLLAVPMLLIFARGLTLLPGLRFTGWRNLRKASGWPRLILIWAAIAAGMWPQVDAHGCIEDLLLTDPAQLTDVLAGKQWANDFSCTNSISVVLLMLETEKSFRLARYAILALDMAALTLLLSVLYTIAFGQITPSVIRPALQGGLFLILLVATLFMLSRSYVVLFEGARPVPHVELRWLSPSRPPAQIEGYLLALAADRVAVYAVRQQGLGEDARPGLQVLQKAGDQQQLMAMLPDRGRSILAVHLNREQTERTMPLWPKALYYIGLPWLAVMIAAVTLLVQPARSVQEPAGGAKSTSSVPPNPGQAVSPEPDRDVPAGKYLGSFLSSLGSGAEIALARLEKAFSLRSGNDVDLAPAPIPGLDIWRYDLASGAQTRLTEGGGFASPRPSADGRRILALKEGRPVVLDADNATIRQMPAPTLARLLGWDETGGRALAEDAAGTLVELYLAKGETTPAPVPAIDGRQLSREGLRNLARITPRLTLLQAVELDGITEVNETAALAQTPRLLFEIEGQVHDPVMTPDEAAVIFVAPGS